MVRRVLDRGKEAARVVKSDVATGVTEAAAAVQEGRQRQTVDAEPEESDEPPEDESYQEARERILDRGDDDGEEDEDRRTLRDRLKSLGDKAERLGERAGHRTGRASKRYSTVRDELAAQATSLQSKAGRIPSAAGVNPTMQSVAVGMQEDYGSGGRRSHNYRRLTNTRSRITYGKRHGDGSQTVVVAARSGEGSWTAQAQEYGPDGRLMDVSQIGELFLSKKNARRALTTWMVEHPEGSSTGGGMFGSVGFGTPSFGAGMAAGGGRRRNEDPGPAFRFTGLDLEGWGLGMGGDGNSDDDGESGGGFGLDFSGFEMDFDEEWGF